MDKLIPIIITGEYANRGLEISGDVLRKFSKTIKSLASFEKLNWTRSGKSSPYPGTFYDYGRTGTLQDSSNREFYVDVGVGKLGGQSGVNVFTRSDDNRQQLTFFGDTIKNADLVKISGAIERLVYSYDGQSPGNFFMIDNAKIRTTDFYEAIRNQPDNYFSNLIFGGNNTLIGSKYSDTLDGGQGTDSITGVPLVDTFRGRGTVDVLTGGSNNDTFILGTRSGTFYSDENTTKAGRSDYARITDFTKGDKIQLKGKSSSYQIKSENLTIDKKQYSVFGLYLNDGSNKSEWDSKDELIGFIQTTNRLALTNSSLAANQGFFTYV